MKQNKNILNYLFICIVINMIPTIMLGTFNVPVKVYTMANGIAYFVELMLMIYSIRKNIMHISNKKIINLLIICFFVFFLQSYVFFMILFYPFGSKFHHFVSSVYQ